MSSQSAVNDQGHPLPPPGGDPLQAEKYIKQLVQLLDSDKLEVTHTDLAAFDPSSLQDHYRIDLKDYQVEVSHNKHPNTGKDSYVILFTNIKNFTQSCEKIILAYMHLNETQFSDFKRAGLEHIVRKEKREEERRLNEALKPVNDILEHLSTESTRSEESINSNDLLSIPISTPAIS